MGKPTDGSYPLNTAKFVKISERLGNGENDMGAVTPIEHTVGGVTLTPETIRLGKKVRPYIIKDGTVLRPNGRTGVFVTLVQRAVEMAVALSHESPRMKLLSEGEIPLVFDANDFPWCGDDLVPIFRLNAIQSSAKCKHSWSQILFRSCKFTAQYVSKLLFQHYIPVKGDFSDLDKTVRYVVDPSNTEQIQQIIKNAQQFCRTKLMWNNTLWICFGLY